jgi:uroporphyrinogen decarboxylase
MPMRIVSFESRRNREMVRLIEKSGGQALVAPSLQEVPLRDSQEALLFGQKLMAGEINGIVFTTGAGVDVLFDILGTRYSQEQLSDFFSKTILVARGPKPLAALRDRGFQKIVSIDEPATSHQVLAILDQSGQLRGQTIAVQEHGSPSQELLDGLAERGARVLRVPVYRWTLPADTEPLRHALNTVISGQADIVLFTNSNQIRQVLRFAQEEGIEKEFRDALSRTVVASIGPVCTEFLDEYGVPVDLQPETPKMDVLVEEASRRGPGLLERKRRPSIVGADLVSARNVGDDREIHRGRAQGPPLLELSPFMKACRREATPYTPIWLMRQAGRYMKEYRDVRDRHGFLDLCKDSDLAAEVTVYAVQRLGVDAAIIFSDILVLVEPMGLMLEYAKGDGPLIHNPIRMSADVSRISSVKDGNGLEFVYDAIRKTRKDLPGHIPLIGFAGAPFTLASYMIEGQGSRNFVHTKSMMYTEPETWRRLMTKIVASLAGYLNAQIAAGAQAVQLFDSWVGCLSPQDYKKYVLPYTRQVVQEIRSQAPVIYFGTETTMFLESMTETGCNVLGVDWRIDLDQAWSRVGPDVAIQGNLDPAVLFAELPEIRRQAKRILDQAGGRPGHIFNLGHGVLPNTPVGHVKALVDAVHEMSQRSLK